MEPWMINTHIKLISSLVYAVTSLKEEFRIAPRRWHLLKWGSSVLIGLILCSHFLQLQSHSTGILMLDSYRKCPHPLLGCWLSYIHWQGSDIGGLVMGIFVVVARMQNCKPCHGDPGFFNKCLSSNYWRAGYSHCSPIEYSAQLFVDHVKISFFTNLTNLGILVQATKSIICLKFVLRKGQ